jgi:3-deoxy-D-manno-octulosonate 8-phosphate phosphatase (KDO 8-P phosphatase)
VTEIKARQTSPEVQEKAKKIEFVLMDVDGVLTDGKLYMGSKGEESKAFHVRDGLGVRMGQRGGLLFGIITGRESKVVADRAEELYITEVHQRVFEKEERFEEIMARLKFTEEQVCFIGDDLVDLPIMRRVGLSASPADAMPEILEAVDYVCARRGGEGAVREVVDLLLRAKNKWEAVTSRFHGE